jgi:hypothetical protein
MITRQQLTRKFLLETLASTTCPACGHPKKTRQTFCGRQYFTLPKAMRTALYARIGEGYEEAVFEAMKYLLVDELHHPQPQLPRGGAA